VPPRVSMCIYYMIYCMTKTLETLAYKPLTSRCNDFMNESGRKFFLKKNKLFTFLFSCRLTWLWDLHHSSGNHFQCWYFLSESKSSVTSTSNQAGFEGSPNLICKYHIKLGNILNSNSVFDTRFVNITCMVF